MSTAIIILGLGRSGSSVTAGILHELGVFMGDEPSRLYEDGEFYQLHQAMIGDWRDPKLQVHPHLFNKYAALIAKRNTHDLWGLKDPRLCFTFPVLLPLLKNTDVRVIYISRPIKDIVRSISVYPGVSGPEEADDIADRYLKALAQTREIVPLEWPVMTLRYNTLVKDPRGQVGRVAKFVGVPVTEAAVELVIPR